MAEYGTLGLALAQAFQGQLIDLIGISHIDSDSMVASWLLKRFGLTAENAKVIFIDRRQDPAEVAQGQNIVMVDSHGGQFDDEDKAKEICATDLVVDHLDLRQDKALQPIIEMAQDADNIRPRHLTDLHYLIIGLPYILKQAQTGETDFDEVVRWVFTLLDVIHEQGKRRVQSDKDLAKFKVDRQFTYCGQPRTLAILTGQPRLRDAAFAAGADVVVWTQPKGKRFYVGIQVSRHSDVTLARAIREIRLAEAQKRNIDVLGLTLATPEKVEQIPGWFLHKSLKLILCGSKTYNLQPEEFTCLSQGEIVNAVLLGLNSPSRR